MGSHPEYPTIESLKAYWNFAQCRRNIIYFSGNRFYWKSLLDSSQPHRSEVRHGDQGVRTIEVSGGERHHSISRD